MWHLELQASTNIISARDRSSYTRKLKRHAQCLFIVESVIPGSRVENTKIDAENDDNQNCFPQHRVAVFAPIGSFFVPSDSIFLSTRVSKTQKNVALQVYEAKTSQIHFFL